MRNNDASLVDIYKNEGFVVINNAATKEQADEFVGKYEPKNYQFIEGKLNHDNYLDGRLHFIKDPQLLNIIFNKKVNNFINEYGQLFLLQLVEARVGTSGIPWHRDNLEIPKPKAREYLGIQIALEDVRQDAGAFEIIHKSHLWDLDTSIINSQNCSENYEDCYGYYQSMINLHESQEIYSFSAFGGDAILWNGKSLHRGKQSVRFDASRRAVFAHLISIRPEEAEKGQTTGLQAMTHYRDNVFMLVQDNDTPNQNGK